MSVLRLSVRHADALDEMVYYLIETPDGAVGVFDGCERDEHGRPTVLLVAQGWFGRRRFEIPVQKIIEVDHGRRRIVLARGAAPLDRSLVQRLSEIGRRGPGEGGVADSRLEGKSGRAVLCGVDGSGQSRITVAVAAHLANRLSVPLVVTHVTPADSSSDVTAPSAAAASRRERQRRDADQLIDALISREAIPADIRRIGIAGDPAARLVEVAAEQNASLPVIGSGHMPEGASATLSQGASDHVAHYAPCPVVLVPPDMPAPT